LPEKFAIIEAVVPEPSGAVLFILAQEDPSVAVLSVPDLPYGNVLHVVA